VIPTSSKKSANESGNKGCIPVLSREKGNESRSILSVEVASDLQENVMQEKDIQGKGVSQSDNTILTT